MPKALILGYGYTGEAIDSVLTEHGFETTGIKRNWTPEQRSSSQCNPIEADVTNPGD